MSTRAMRRAERRKERKKQEPRERARSFPWFSALVVAVVVVLGGIGLKAAGAFDSAPAAPAIDASTVQLNKGQPIPTLSRDHLQSGERFNGYNSVPPTSGPHDPTPLPWGVYTTTQPDERMIHNLEHGGVLIAYSPSISQEDLDKLRALRTRWPRDKYQEVKVLIEPYPKLESGQIAVAAWGWLDTMTGYDERRVTGFLAAHLDQGPEDAP